ncbi:MAG: hemin uptake protein HemP [Pseudomonadota bacterium]
MNAVTQVPQPANAEDLPKIAAYDARDLVRDGVQANIVLDGQVYVLRITRAGKLILTK